MQTMPNKNPKDVPVRITRTKLSKRQKLPEISKNNIPHLHRRLEAKKSTATQAPNSYAITTNGQGACSPGSSELFVPRTTSHRSPGQGNAGRTLTLSPSQPLFNHTSCRPNPFDGTRYAFHSMATISPVRENYPVWSHGTSASSTRLLKNV